MKKVIIGTGFVGNVLLMGLVILAAMAYALSGFILWVMGIAFMFVTIMAATMAMALPVNAMIAIARLFN